MSVVWSRNGTEWTPTELSGEGLPLLSIIEPGPDERPTGSAPTLRCHTSPRQAWTLLAPAGGDLTVNGEPVQVGIRALRDRDVIQVDDRGPVYFSTESLALVTPCPKTERAIQCVRCKTLIEVGSSAVECPRCSAWHHQTSELPCFRYTDNCTLCQQPTDIDAGYSWRPEDL